jgi:hypothetical protein
VEHVIQRGETVLGELRLDHATSLPDPLLNVNEFCR